MVKISDKVSRSLNEYFILTGDTPKSATYQNVNLTTKLAPNVILRYPFIAAAMSCVSGYDMTLECAKNGMMAVVPCSLTIEDQVDIVRRVKEKEVKEGDIEFNSHPTRISDLRETIGDAAELYEVFGHSNIPICDSFRHLHAMFRYQQGIPSEYLGMTIKEAIERSRKDDYLSEIIKPFDMKKSVEGRDYFWRNASSKRIQKTMNDAGIKVIPIMRSGGVLEKIAFIYNFHGYMVGAAIHTHKGWETRAHKLIEAGVDMIFTDSSDAKTDFQLGVIDRFKNRFDQTPLCIGNIIDAEGYKRFSEAGVDVIKIGMGSGGSCTTTEGRGIGRGIATAMMDVAEERKRSKKKVPLIGDGGIGTRKLKTRKLGEIKISEYKHDPSTITKSLGIVDVDMLGTAFNMFEEAAGESLEVEGKKYKERWGEGSLKAKSLARYGVGESIKRANVVEGDHDYVTCVGRLKPGIEKIALNVQLTFSNVGAVTPEEYREKCVLELASPQAQKEAGVG